MIKRDRSTEEGGSTCARTLCARAGVRSRARQRGTYPPEPSLKMRVHTCGMQWRSSRSTVIRLWRVQGREANQTWLLTACARGARAALTVRSHPRGGASPQLPRQAHAPSHLGRWRQAARQTWRCPRQPRLAWRSPHFAPQSAERMEAQVVALVRVGHLLGHHQVGHPLHSARQTPVAPGNR